MVQSSLLMVQFVTLQEHLHIYLDQAFLTSKYVIFNSRVQQVDLVTAVAVITEIAFN
jgi:hypothetical protein